MRGIFKIIRNLGFFKTLRFNFYYLPFKAAIKFPILVSKKVFIRNLGGKIEIGCKIKPGLLKIGFDSLGIVDYKNERVVWDVSGKIKLSGNADFGAATKIGVRGILSLGHLVQFTGKTNLIVNKDITIGQNSIIGWDCQIMDTDLHPIIDADGVRINPDKPIKIDDHVWIGSRCLVLKGSYVPCNSVIAAESIVSKKLEASHCVYGGNPLRILKAGINWNYK